MATARYYNEDKNEGGAQHIYGVPLRDLTEEEYEGMPKWLQEQVDGSPMYRKTNPNPTPKTTTAPKAIERAEKAAEASSTTDATEDTQDTE